MKLVILVTVFLISSLECEQYSSDHLWHLWKKVHGKQYDNQHTEAKRLDIWQKAVARIQEHNLKHDMGLETYRMGVNQFSDLTWDEFKATYLGGEIKIDTIESDEQVADHGHDIVEASDIPESWDWRDHGRVTSVKYQGQCGSCWAFSAAGAMEGQMHKKGLNMTDLSTQQLVDCSWSYGNEGCNGGLFQNAFKYAVHHGMESWKMYPYKAKDETCAYKHSKVVFKIDSYRNVKRGNEGDLLDAVYRVGPTSVAVDVEHDFMHYKSGVYTSKSCSPNRINHAILAVGFGEQNGKKYWLVKNSWGTWWGESGYIKIGRNMGNMCGIASVASVPLVK